MEEPRDTGMLGRFSTTSNTAIAASLVQGCGVARDAVETGRVFFYCFKLTLTFVNSRIQPSHKIEL